MLVHNHSTILFADLHYILTHPLYDPLHISPDISRKLEIPAPQMGRTFKIHVSPSQNLLSDDFKYLETVRNGSQEIIHTLKDNCYYRSEATALDLCEGVVGTYLPFYIYVYVNVYVLHP